PHSLTSVSTLIPVTSIHSSLVFSFHHAATTEIYTLSLHDALPIYWIEQHCIIPDGWRKGEPFTMYDWQLWCTANHYRVRPDAQRSEEHTSELQSRENLVCRLLLEKKKNQADEIT